MIGLHSLIPYQKTQHQVGTLNQLPFGVAWSPYIGTSCFEYPDVGHSEQYYPKMQSPKPSFGALMLLCFRE